MSCEHVVSATGNFARKTGAMVGLNIPVIPVEHQYIVTEAHPDIKARHKDGKPEMGVLRDSEGQWYMREEAGGLILGLMRPVHPFAMWMDQVMSPNMSCFRKISNGLNHISNQP